MCLSILPTRPAVHADISGLLDLYRHLNPGDLKPDVAAAERVFDRFMTHDGSAIFVGDMNRELAVSCMLAVVPNLTRDASPDGLIEIIVTHRDFRKRGFGKQVLAAAATAAWDAGCWKLMLMTGSTRPEALNFYLGVEFEQSKTGFQMRDHPSACSLRTQRAQRLGVASMASPRRSPGGAVFRRVTRRLPNHFWRRGPNPARLASRPGKRADFEAVTAVFP